MITLVNLTPMQPLVGCSLSLQVARWPWIYHLGMEPSHQVTSALLLMLSLRNGKGSTLFSLHGHGYLGQNHHGRGLFVTREHVHSQEDHDEKSHKGNEEPNCLGKDEYIDNATLSYRQDVRYFDFHIVYSASYRVPVLYFRTYSSDGQPLLLEDIEKELPGNSTNVLMESKWTFITQEEHPYLNRPWYKLHPCGTSEWMKLLFLTDPSLGGSQGVPVELYLSSWISMVGQAVGLKVPLEMFNKRKE
ncbi:ubiquitin-like-conjugating enzyme ATG10 isoform X2 [Vitis riparia]|uniref:ubiquitin-like-conjugating enzyme ATG10 isoform X2 n=1 Tax=Vitis riparia TaxID=96939 RepID=UPI00155AE4AD|nr:ubiquitin-like-conjugating enzyme ATG10 isoform X2 [Vitis riparia]